MSTRADAPWIARTLAQQFEGVTDEHLAQQLDNALADLAQAERYEASATLIPPITRFIARLQAEQARRAADQRDPEVPDAR